MNHPGSINIADFNYELPEEKIAAAPTHGRGDSRLLVYNKGVINDHIFTSINAHIPAQSSLVFNNTKVVKARLSFQKETGAAIEVFCLEPQKGITVEQSFSQRHTTNWICMVGNSKKWRGEILKLKIFIDNSEVILSAQRLENYGQESLIQFTWDNANFSFSELLEIVGELPLPPYMNRSATADDRIRYNTVYAVHEGSVAAPTAGLHFTDGLLEDLKSNGTQMLNVLLHVGAGTFKPVKADAMQDHVMHAERIKVSIDTIEKLLLQKKLRKIIPVGTTSTRTLESLYWMGVQILEHRHKEGDFSVSQWEPYESENNYSVDESLTALINYAKAIELDFVEGFTQIIIAPGYQFKIIDGLITNFHQPQSTLLLLVAALIGNDWRKVYEHALQNNYRFLSYGDSSLLLP
jgi:S-adenosylmethionine:tRNA ribosyltransferase-isomerase